MSNMSPMATEASNKRPRSPSVGDIGHPPSKAAKVHSNHLQINYLARQYTENIPLVNGEDTLPSILRLIGEYDGVLHRHESIAGNLGACPLGPILMKRFERLFDGPPRILKSHSKEANITWLDVVEFARNKPEQFNLEKTRNGIRVCQFYTKQSRVEISEEDYVLIASGMPQKLIPPQPIIEDEEKELSALDILEKNLTSIISLADQVSARARQLNHRLKNRKAAIISRRAELEAGGRSYPLKASSPPSALDYGNGHARQNGNVGSAGNSPPAAFAAVTVRTSASEPRLDTMLDHSTPYTSSTSNLERLTHNNGSTTKDVPEYKAELVKQFISTADRETRNILAQADEERRLSQGLSRPSPSARTKPRSDSNDYNAFYSNSVSTHVAIPHTPASLLPPFKQSQAERDDGGPYKAEMVARMEQMHRGERVMPPCDRCRRLHMDCLKNLTACMGCTKKHAKCAWKDVREEELREGLQLDEDGSPVNYDSANSVTNRSNGRDSVTEASMTATVSGPYPVKGNVNPIPEPTTTHNPGHHTTGHYSTEDDDITRAILEEKDEPNSESPAHEAQNQRSQASSHPAPPTASVPTVGESHSPLLKTERRIPTPPVPPTSAPTATNEKTASINGTKREGNGQQTAHRRTSTGTSNGHNHNNFNSLPRTQSSTTYHPPLVRPEYSQSQSHSYSQYSNSNRRQSAVVNDDSDDDDGDRLQKAAAEVYRSASAGGRP